MNFIASQLGKPRGIFGWLLGQMWNRRNAVLNDAALACLDVDPADRVLEVGFGGGYLLRRISAQLPQGWLAGVDHSMAVINSSTKRLHHHIQVGRLVLGCASSEALPFPTGAFDRVVSVNSIFYWLHPAQALSEMHRVLGDSGCLVLIFTSRESLRKRGFTDQKLGLYSVPQVTDWLLEAGFHSVESYQEADIHRRYWVVKAN